MKSNYILYKSDKIMIEIKEKVEQVVYFPKNSDEILEVYSLELHSELSQKSYTFSVVDSGKSNRYYKFTVDFSVVDDGEYNYSISGIDTGLIRIGEINQNHSVSSFDDEVEVIQYGSNVKQRYQHKEVNINQDGTYVITPDAGYDALSKVTAYVNIPQTGHTDEEMEEAYGSGYTNGYNSGYTSGKTDGVAEQKAKLIGLNINSNGSYTRPDGWSAITVNVPTGSTINNQNKTVNVVANGSSAITFDAGYTGLGTVSLNVNVPQTGHTDEEMEEAYQSGFTNGYNSGYDSGYTDGYTSGKTDGYNSGYTAGYDSGYTDGQESASAVQMFNLTVNLQSTDTSGLIGNAVVTVSYNSITSSKTYNGTGLNFEILPGVDYVISFSSVDDYLTPASLTGTSTWNGARVVNATYEYTNPDIPFKDQYLTLEIVSGGTLLFGAHSNNNKEFKYSLNGGEWTILNFAGPSSSQTNKLVVAAGDKVRLKQDNPTFSTSTNSNYIASSGNTGTLFNVYGNIMSLAYGDDFQNKTTLPTTYYFKELFSIPSGLYQGKTGVVDASNLVMPATTVTNYGYYRMFKEATRLTAAPALPATSVGNYAYTEMFYNCNGLTQVPALPATTLGIYCYQGMFQYLDNITVAPALPATTLAQGCYDNMFNGCFGLTTASHLPATILPSECYRGMFFNCTSLASVPEIPAFTSIVSNSMTQMFSGCRSLNYIKCLTNSPSATQMGSWLYGVADEGTFVKKAGVEWERGVNGIPTNWSVIEE